jgi:hypothetical protein
MIFITPFYAETGHYVGLHITAAAADPSDPAYVPVPPGVSDVEHVERVRASLAPGADVTANIDPAKVPVLP